MHLPTQLPLCIKECTRSSGSGWVSPREYFFRVPVALLANELWVAKVEVTGQVIV